MILLKPIRTSNPQPKRIMIVTIRNYKCPCCRQMNRFSLPTEQRTCTHCGQSLLCLYREEDFQNTDNPEIISNWLRVAHTRNFGLSEPPLCRRHNLPMVEITRLPGWGHVARHVCPKCHEETGRLIASSTRSGSADERPAKSSAPTPEGGWTWE